MTSYINFKQAKSYSYISGDDPFEYVCDDALSKIIGKEKPLYDIILIDEAQDLPSPFFKLCKKVLKKDGRLVIAYDELQNLTTGSPLNIKETFKDVDFENKPNEPKKDIILPVCYRNPREIIVTAHAIGFGIYRENKGKRELVQFFDNPNLWSDVGYEVLAGQLKAGQQEQKILVQLLINIIKMILLIVNVLQMLTKKQNGYVSKFIKILKMMN